jgi:hypothetical protein
MVSSSRVEVSKRWPTVLESWLKASVDSNKHPFLRSLSANPIPTFTSNDILSLPLSSLPPASRFSFPQPTLLPHDQLPQPQSLLPSADSITQFFLPVIVQISDSHCALPSSDQRLNPQSTPLPADRLLQSNIAPVCRLSQLSITLHRSLHLQ